MRKREIVELRHAPRASFFASVPLDPSSETTLVHTLGICVKFLFRKNSRHSCMCQVIR